MIHIVVALHCEAKPLIQAYKLKQNTTVHAYPVFENENKRVVISGIGKCNAAAATAFLGALYPAKIWVNVGIAGHQEMELGTPFLVNKITDHATGKVDYPAFPFTPHLPTIHLTTHDQPVFTYGNTACDMEASGFYSSAKHFSTVELIHCFKVISDNQHHPAKINKKLFEDLITKKIASLNQLLNILSDIDIHHQTPMNIERFLSQWHFTTTQTHQLQQFLRGVNEEALWNGQINQCKNSKDVLKYLKKMNDEKTLNF